MKYNGYSRFIHSDFVRVYGSHMAELTADQFELWWRMMSDEERKEEYEIVLKRLDEFLDDEI